MSKGPTAQSHKSARAILKTLPEYQIEEVIKFMKVQGLEREIAFKSYVEKKSIQEILDEIHVSSTKTYHIHNNRFLRKFELSLNDINDKLGIGRL